MRRTITQEDSMGCGVACVAFIAHKPYRQAVVVLGQNKAKTVGFQLNEIVDALAYYRLSYHFKHVKPNIKHRIYEDGAIIFIKRSTRYPYGHYLVRHKGLWVDPWINLVVDKKLENAKSGYRQRLPGKAQWAVLPLPAIIK